MENYRTGSPNRFDIEYHFVWARGRFVASSGTVTDEVIMEYIRQQEGAEPNDGGENFQATPS